MSIYGSNGFVNWRINPEFWVGVGFADQLQAERERVQVQRERDVEYGAWLERERIIELLESMSDWYYNKAIERLRGTQNERSLHLD